MSHTLPAITWDMCQVWESLAVGGETEPAQSSAWGARGILLPRAITIHLGIQQPVVTFCCRH